MDQTERQVIDGLFDKLAQADRAGGQRDAQAERHIKELVSRNPAAPYFMAQAILVQEHALKQAQQRIEELENDVDEQPAGGGGSFLGGLFGGGAAPQRNGGSVPRAGAGGSRYPSQAQADAANSPVAQYQRTGQGGGFLAGAMQTAVGVAGGVVLGNMLMGAFGGNEAKAETPAAAEPAEENKDANVQEAENDGGGWFGGGDDDGGFDT